MNILILFFLFFSNFDYIPVLHEGRIRPFGSIESQSLLEEQVIPLNINPGDWKTLESTKGAKSNFSLFKDEDFQELQGALNGGLNEEIAEKLLKAYKGLENKTFKMANMEDIQFPSLRKLKLEVFYTRFPWIPVVLFCTLFSLVFLSFSLFTRSDLYLQIGVFASGIGFVIHSTLLILRVIILERPAVASMYETMLFVPWVAVSLSFILFFIYRQALLLLAGNLINFALFSLLLLTDRQAHLEPLQPVLNSQLWLSTHVILVVASYGVFAIASIVGHAFFLKLFFGNKSEMALKPLEKVLLQILYIGVVLLTAGTILGGVWAAQSWGRFWDWDPKEAWAFISIALYLVCIHLYRFNKIGNRGLAFGAVAGFLAISFCWYGVNYIIGSGMHSYGFGSGGSTYYLSFIGFEILFLLFALTTMQKNKIVRRKIYSPRSKKV